MTAIVEVREGVPGPKLTCGVHPIRYVYSSGHTRWAKLHLTVFSKQFYKSRIVSIPCCNAACKDVFDREIDGLHTERLGQGQWLKTQRTELPCLSEGRAACAKQEEAAALQQLGIEEERIPTDDETLGVKHQRLKKRLRDLPLKNPTEEGQLAKKKKLSSEAAGITKDLKALADAANENRDAISLQEFEELDELVAMSSKATSFAFFVQNVRTGIMVLNSSTKNQGKLFKLVEYRQNCLDKGSNPLEELLGNETTLTSLIASMGDSGSESHGYTLLSNNISVFRSFLLDHVAAENSTAASTTTLSPKLLQALASITFRLNKASGVQRKNNKKYAKACQKQQSHFNRVVNELSRHVGASALGLYAAIEAKGAKLSCFRDITEDEVSFFLPSLVKGIKPMLSEIRDNIPVLHVPGVLSWLLGVEYADMCLGLGLPFFAKKNPGIAARLDALTAQLKALNPNSPTCEEQLVQLDQSAKNEMRVRMSWLCSDLVESNKDTTSSETHQSSQTAAQTPPIASFTSSRSQPTQHNESVDRRGSASSSPDPTSELGNRNEPSSEQHAANSGSPVYGTMRSLFSQITTHTAHYTDGQQANDPRGATSASPGAPHLRGAEDPLSPSHNTSCLNFSQQGATDLNMRMPMGMVAGTLDGVHQSGECWKLHEGNFVDFLAEDTSSPGIFGDWSSSTNIAQIMNSTPDQ